MKDFINRNYHIIVVIFALVNLGLNLYLIRQTQTNK